MEITPENKLKKVIIVGDRVLIKPKKYSDKTKSGLYLPPGVQEKEKIQSTNSEQKAKKLKGRLCHS